MCNYIFLILLYLCHQFQLILSCIKVTKVYNNRKALDIDEIFYILFYDKIYIRVRINI